MSEKTIAAKFKRVLIKLSGEALMGEDHDQLYDMGTVTSIINSIKTLVANQVKIGIVIGGGNIFRGASCNNFGLIRENADYMGMLATVMNGIALANFLENAGVKSKTYSAFAVGNIIKQYNRESMLKNIESSVIIFSGGTGNPFFSTDSGAALRAIEMEADLLIKATNVDGVYTEDPKINVNASKYSQLTFDEAIKQNLKIMDMAAFDLCRTHQVNIDVCNIFKANALFDSVTGHTQGTLIYG